MLSRPKKMENSVEVFLSTPIGEKQLNILFRCIDEDDQDFLHALMEIVKKNTSELNKWEMHPGVFLRKLNEYSFSASGRRDALYRCCLVRVSGFTQSFSYLTDDLTLMSGDHVLVPFGHEDRRQLAEIIKIMDCTADNTPFPIEKMKTIIGRIDAPIE